MMNVISSEHIFMFPKVFEPLKFCWEALIRLLSVCIDVIAIQTNKYSLNLSSAVSMTYE